MYLSRLILNLRSRQVRRELSDLYQIHRTVMHAFPSQLQQDERVLFRVDLHPRSGVPTLLVQSQHPPAWDFLTESGKDYLLSGDELPVGIENPAVKNVDLPLTHGQVLSFRLRANPTVKKNCLGDKQGQRKGLYRPEEQLAWLKRKLEAGGAILLSASLAHDEWVTTSLHRGNESHALQYASVQFDGILQVNDPTQLQQTLQLGIGSGKGMGFGLLSLAPARG